jgi:hypothetical protein
MFRFTFLNGRTKIFGRVTRTQLGLRSRFGFGRCRMSGGGPPAVAVFPQWFGGAFYRSADSGLRRNAETGGS